MTEKERREKRREKSRRKTQKNFYMNFRMEILKGALHCLSFVVTLQTAAQAPKILM